MSNNLNISQVSPSQNNKETTINDATGGIDAALTEDITIEVDSSNEITLTSAQFRQNQFFTIDEDSGTPADSDITVTVPAIKRGTFAIINDTAFDVTVEIDSQPETPPVVDSGERSLLSCDGSNVRLAGGGGGSGGGTYDFGFAFGVTPSENDVLNRLTVARGIIVSANMAGSAGNVDTNPDSSWDIDVLDDGVSIGTITISTGGAFSFATTGGSPINIEAGSEITFVSGAVSSAADGSATIAAIVD